MAHQNNQEDIPNSKMQQETRILFLRAFTKELIKQSRPKIYVPIIQKEAELPIKLPSDLEKIKPKKQIKPITQIYLSQQPPQFQPLKIQPEIKPIPAGFNLGKLEKLIRDPGVSMIECPGPEKLILVRQAGNVKTTQLSLSEQEIRQIIESFASQARIPLMTGIFKAAIGNLIITAVISEFVGSRFIITRMLG